MIHTKKMILFLFSLVILALPMSRIQANSLVPAGPLVPIEKATPEPMALGNHMDKKIGAQMPQSEQDMNRMVQELEKASKEIDTFVKSLPPAEQDEFNRIVQQVEQKMSQTDPAVLERFLTNQMNPEELDQFLGNVFEGITPPTLTPEEKPEETTKPQKKEEKPTPKEISKINRALDTIEIIIKKTDSFILKTQEFPELAAKVKRWGKRGIIYDWEPSFEWDKVKKDIASLRQSMQKLIEKDPKNNTYKYLNDFVEQESLVNNVEKLKTTLVEYEPTIETSAFGLEKMDAVAKKALTRTISGYTEALYRLKITEDLNKIFEKYEPRAKELREEKEKLEKEAKKIKPTGPSQSMITAGREETFGSDYSSYYNPQDYGNYYGGSPSYESSYGPSYEGASEKTSTEPKDEKGGGSNKPSGGDKGGGKEESGPKDTKKEGSSGDKGDKSGDKKSAPVKEAEPIEKKLKEITESMNVAGLTVKNDKDLMNLSEHIINPEAHANAQIVELPIRYLKKAQVGIDALKEEIDKKNDEKVATRVQKRLEEIIKEHKPVFEKVIKQIKDLDNMTPGEFTKISEEKRTAYLGERLKVATTISTDAKKDVELEEKSVPTLRELPKEWETVEKTVKEFNKKAEEPTKKVVPTVAPLEPSTNNSGAGEKNP